jgi:hypothetical protein
MFCEIRIGWADNSDIVIIVNSSLRLIDANDVPDLASTSKFRISHPNIDFVRIVPPMDVQDLPI